MAAPRRVVGILGGMGPAATVDLFARIVESSPARTDQDHLHILIENNPAVPDRTAAILEDGPDPLPLLRAGADRLEAQGAELLAIPCNTAHHFLPQLRQGLSCQVLDMIAEAAAAIRACHGPGIKVGILATAGTLACGLYQRALEAERLDWLIPSEDGVDLLMQAIYGQSGIKSVGPSRAATEMVRRVCRELAAAGAQVMLLGCTELPLALSDGDVPWPLADSSQMLAEAVIREAYD